MLKFQILGALFAIYVFLCVVQARRTLLTSDQGARQTEAKRLLLVVTLGVPIAIAAIFYLM
ncbi:MAG: hypothetical protein WCL53_08035 [Chloroflexota bacterium]